MDYSSRKRFGAWRVLVRGDVSRSFYVALYRAIVSKSRGVGLNTIAAIWVAVSDEA